VNVTDSSFTGTGGVRIFTRCWTPDGQPRAVVILVHGAGEHLGRYEHVAAALLAQGHAVYASDHRGHGRSDGPRALVDRLANAVADVDQLVVTAAAAHPGLPVFMLGHSMGGLIALHYAAAHQQRLVGIVLSGTLAQLDDVPAALRMIGRTLSVVAPRAGLIAIDPALISRDQAVVESYRSDPLVHHGKLPARTAVELADAVAALAQLLPSIGLPALVLYGTEDGLCPPSGSVMIGERIGSEDRTVKGYDGLLHEILNEPERDAVLAEICGWLAARCGERRAEDGRAGLGAGAAAAGSSTS
jgi:acylglycerol lipase